MSSFSSGLFTAPFLPICPLLISSFSTAQDISSLSYRSDPFSFLSLHCLLSNIGMVVSYKISKWDQFLLILLGWRLYDSDSVKFVFVWLKKSEECFLHGVLKGKNLYKEWDWKSMVTFQYFFLCMHLLFCYMKANNFLLSVKKPGLWEGECRRWKIKI